MAENVRGGASAMGGVSGDRDQLLVGFDFGTSCTALMTNRGHKELIRSVVGYPKDMIGIKLLGAPYVVGAKAYEMRSYVDLRSPLQDGVLREYVERDLDAARHFVGHVIDTLGPRPDEEVCVIVGAPARASNTNKDLLMKVFQEFTDVVQVISEPFLVAYGRGTLVKSMVIDIGAGTVDICVLKGVMPGQKSQITVNRAGNFVDEQLMGIIVETYPDVQMNLHMARAIKEQHGFIGVPEKQIMADLRAEGRPVSYDVTEAVRAACETLMPSIMEGIEKLIQTSPPEDQGSILKNIVVAGGGSRVKGIAQYISGRLRGYGEVGVSCVSDPDFAVAAGALKLAQELPPRYWEQLGSTTDY
nr:Magnetosome protein MamK (MreB-actin-like) [uncultured bacterium]